jgi:phage terminase small subunit
MKRSTKKAGSNLNKSRLSGKQRAFCREYVREWNGTKSYMKVYGVKSEDVAGASSARLLRNVRIQAFCDELEKNLEKTTGISKISVVLEHKTIAFSKAEETKDRQKSLDSISKLLGYDSAGKLELTGKDGKPLIPQVIKIEVINSRDQVKKDEQK